MVCLISVYPSETPSDRRKLCLNRVQMAGKITDMTKDHLNETSNKITPGQIVGYARVSSAGQNFTRQLEALEAAGCERIFQEKVSGAKRDRAQLDAALTYLREGDTLVCTSMDRLARSLPDLHAIVNELTGRGVAVQFLKEGQIYSQESDSVSKLMLNLLGAVAEFERSLIRERQAEGIARAKKKGIYRGRQLALTRDQQKRLIGLVQEGVPKSEVARRFGISRATVYRYLNADLGINPLQTNCP